MDASKATAVAVPLAAEDVAESKAAVEATYHRPDVAGICVADGFGVKVTVNRGALVVEDGIGKCRRTRRYDKSTHAWCSSSPRASSPSRPCAGAARSVSAWWCSAPMARLPWPALRA